MILGMHLIGHDLGFAIINNGKIVEILECERVNGSRFAQNWDWCIDRELKYDEKLFIKTYVNRLEFFWDKYAEKIKYSTISHPWHPQWVKACFNYGNLVTKTLNRIFDINIKYLQPVNHHLSHASLAFFTSPFEESNILSYDARGNDGFNNEYYGSKNDIKLIKFYDHLYLGRVYIINGKIIEGDFGLNVTAWAGKLMGLSAYGKYDKKLVKKVRQLIFEFGIYRKKIHKIKVGKETDERAQSWMKTFQNEWSVAVGRLADACGNETKNLCLTGGCALNGITNHHLAEKGYSIYVPPNPNDSGLAAGSALYAYYCILKNTRTPIKCFNPYIGISILDEDEIDQYRDRLDYKGKVTTKEIAKLLKGQKVIGFISGNSEVGPRALGNRSILCDCSDPNMKDILNQKVKFREWYRPFAPVVRAEDQSEYFEFDRPSPYMSYVVPTVEKQKESIPATVHVDGTARLQTVSKDMHPQLHNLLSVYKSEYGVGVLLNTSFNIKGRSILTKMSTAMEILDTTKLDAVVYNYSELWM